MGVRGRTRRQGARSGHRMPALVMLGRVVRHASPIVVFPFYAEVPERASELQAAQDTAEEARRRVREQRVTNMANAQKTGAAVGKYLAKKPKAEANYGAGAIEGGVGAYPY